MHAQNCTTESIRNCATWAPLRGYPMVESPPKLLTVGVIAERHGAKVHQVLHVIRTRGVEPIGTAGLAKIYSEADAGFIGSELRRIARDKEVGRGA
jgi:hypothetical protein